jgi:hypothetical protein
MSGERIVELKGVPEKEAPGMLHQEGLFETTAEKVAAAVPQFTEVKLPEFKARFAFIDNDAVIHFFLPSAAGNLGKADAMTQRKWEAYWMEVFPALLSSVSKEHFRADKPRLVAKYTEDFASWWFRARGYGDSLNPAGLIQTFLEKLASALAAQLPS